MRLHLSILFLILFFSINANVVSQNLVPNASFEELDSCPPFTPGWLRMHHLKFWTCANWPMIDDNADSYHCCYSPSLCNGEPNKLPPRTGEGYVGMFVYSKPTVTLPPDISEYIQVKLELPLISGKEYRIAVYSYMSYGVFTCNCLEAYFSPVEINENKWILSDITPQVQFNEIIFNEWLKLNGSYVAQGGEEYIVIGRFSPKEQISLIDNPNPYNNDTCVYLYIDDVAVWPADAPVYSANAGGNQFVCRTDQQRDSVTLGTHNLDEYLYTWFDADSNIVGNSGFLTVLPDTSTWYVLEVKDFKFDISHDTVWVYVIDCNDPLFIPNIFSPNGDGQNDVLYVRGQGIEQLTFTVYNRWGEVVFQTTDPAAGWDGTYKGRRAEPSVYVYHVSAVLQDGLVVNKHGDVTLVR